MASISMRNMGSALPLKWERSRSGLHFDIKQVCIFTQQVMVISTKQSLRTFSTNVTDVVVKVNSVNKFVRGLSHK